MDNRLWRSLKYEEVYIRDYQCVSEGRRGIDYYFNFYNHERPHQSLNYMTPAEAIFKEPPDEEKKDAYTYLLKRTHHIKPKVLGIQSAIEGNTMVRSSPANMEMKNQNAHFTVASIGEPVSLQLTMRLTAMGGVNCPRAML